MSKRIQAFVLLTLIMLLCPAPLWAEEPPVSELSRTVGSVYGKAITAADIGLTAPIDPAIEFDARNTEQWHLMGRITQAFGKPVSERFVKERKIDATEEEIAAFKKTMREQRKKNLREFKEQLEEAKAELAQPDLPDEERSKLEKKQAMYERLLGALRETTERDSPESMVRLMIVAWKTERELHRAYGGRVIFQQFGLEALDARRMLYEDAEKKGDLKFDDAGVRHLFYYYYSDMKHVVVDEKVLENPWFLDGGRSAELQSLREKIRHLSRRVAALEKNRVTRTPRPATVKTEPKAPQPEKTWTIIKSANKSMKLAPRKIVPVDSGVWFGGSGPIGFFDLNEGRVTLLIENGNANWDAVGTEALAVQLDRKSLIKLSATDQSVATWDKRPEGCKYFTQVAAHEQRFYVSAAYAPLWIFDPASDSWQKLELDLVTDSDSERLGPRYYRPNMDRFVLGSDGDLWGFQGTHDGGRGNAVCHYLPGQSKWEHFGFPWATGRGDDHWIVGVTASAVWFAGQENDLLLFDKKSHRWSTSQSGWPEGRFGSARFTQHGVLIPVGNTVKKFMSESSTWDTVATLAADERITAVAASTTSLYLATASGIYVLDTFFGEPTFYPWKFGEQAKTYQAVFGLPSHGHVLELADKLCKAATEGELERVKALLAEGADIEATTDSAGSTPLLLACSKGHMDVVKLLIEHGADIHARNRSRQNALAMANRGRHRELADYLISKGVKR